ncbi:hypothetical protein [Ruminiclostridium cellobioparum]|uniref:hypothetical protein n=1 Tax=Ruminiclostridium cellobioparum TaxID=29355 RepID=UPI000347A32D|nr:hypothetical protein [Ruminiclostridium cellobioparum]
MGKLNFKRKYMIISIAVTLMLCISAVFFFFIKPGLSTIKIEYTIKPQFNEEKTVEINMKIIRDGIFSPVKIILGSSSFNPIDAKCMDSDGNEVLFSAEDNKLILEPSGSNPQYIDLSYKVKIGDFSGSAYQGIYKDDLIAFSGEGSLFFPYFDYDQEGHGNIGRTVSKIVIKTDAGSGIKEVVPYQKNGGKQLESVEINNPDWNVIYNLSKSCYAFGDFINKYIKGRNGDVNILFDPAYKSQLPDETVRVIGSLYDYYAELFGGGLEDCPIIILKNDRAKENTTVAGIGGKSLGISMEPGNENDIRTFSHSLYSAFFDNKINAVNLHYQPNLWLYKGLATYYENLSLDCLGENAGKNYRFNSSDGFAELYSRYIYFRLKEPSMYKLSPADEKSALQGQLQFFFYTEAPLVIKSIEDMAETAPAKKNALLTYLLEYRAEKNINVGELMLAVAGEREELIRNYLSGDTIMPYSGSISEKEEPEIITRRLDDYERLLCSWNQQEIPIYPYDRIFLLEPEKIADASIAENVVFASKQTEEMVGNFSPTIFMLLKQYKLRADVCGLKDINDPLLKYKLLSDEVNINKWNEYIKNLGLDSENDEIIEDKKSN